MDIKSAKYFKTDVYGEQKNVSVFVTLQDNTLWSVPLNVADNRHWIQLQEWAKTNTIEEAD